MRVLTCNPAQPRRRNVDEAVRALESGELLALPTDTFYGLAVDSGNVESLERLNGIKQRGERSPVLLLLADRSQVATVSDSVPPRFDALADMFWPGPLTLVVPASPRLSEEVTAGGSTVAVRVPGLALPRELARGLGRPITGPSANLHGRRPCRTALEVVDAFSAGIDLILDGGPTTGGAPSTIVDLSGPRPVVLREGLLPSSSLRSFLPELEDR